MARKKPTLAQLRLKRARQLDKKKPGFGSYTYRLSVVRQISGAFDAKKYDTLKFSRPKTAKQKAAKRRALNNFNRTFHRLRHYVAQPHKVLKFKDKKRLEAMRKYVGAPRIRKLKGIAFPTNSKRVSVRFDKKFRPLIREDGVGQKMFLFPRKPRPHQVREADGSKRFVDAADDAVEMLKAMLPEMPPGFYVFMTRHQFLIADSSEKDSLVQDLRRFYHQYGQEPDFVKTLIGVKFLTDSVQQWKQWKLELFSRREAEKGKRKRQRIARALKEIIAMDKQLKSGKPLSRGQITRRAKITGRR